nr:MAG TPA: hypothetical protein [Caudoviricetes sp.]
MMVGASFCVPWGGQAKAALRRSDARRTSAREKIVVTLTPRAWAMAATASTPRRRLALSVFRTVLRLRPVSSTMVSMVT